MSDDLVKVPTWNFQCVREIENAKREERERMGAWPQYEKNVKDLCDRLGAAEKKNREYLDSLNQTAEEIASDDELDRKCAETVLRLHHHPLILFILIFGCTHVHPFAVYSYGYERLLSTAPAHIMVLWKRSLVKFF